jgi:hypothetical protein
MNAMNVRYVMNANDVKNIKNQVKKLGFFVL